MLDIFIFRHILFWTFVSYQAHARNQVWIDPSSCTWKLEDTIDEVQFLGRVAWTRMQPESDDDNQHLIYDTLWKEPPPTNYPDYNLNIVNSKSYKEYALYIGLTSLRRQCTHCQP